MFKFILWGHAQGSESKLCRRHGPCLQWEGSYNKTVLSQVYITSFYHYPFLSSGLGQQFQHWSFPSRTRRSGLSGGDIMKLKTNSHQCFKLWSVSNSALTDDSPLLGWWREEAKARWRGHLIPYHIINHILLTFSNPSSIFQDVQPIIMFTPNTHPLDCNIIQEKLNITMYFNCLKYKSILLTNLISGVVALDAHQR